MSYQPLDNLSSASSSAEGHTKTNTNTNAHTMSKAKELSMLFQDDHKDQDHKSSCSTQSTSSFISSLVEKIAKGQDNDIPTACDIPSQQHTSNDVNVPTLSSNESRQQYAILALALILLGHGCADEAHDLVTPLSWSEPTHFGYIHNPNDNQSKLPTSTQNSSILSSPSKNDRSIKAMASYIHGLVHRYESFNVGEYNMNGYQNANYWTNTALSYAECSVIPFGTIRECVLQSVSLSTSTFSTSTCVQEWIQERIIDEGYSLDPSYHDYWESRALHELCAKVITARTQSSNAPSSSSMSEQELDELQNFAESAAEIELKVLVKECLESLGYDSSSISLRGRRDCTTATDTSSHDTKESHPLSSVDEGVAMRAANKISSAHFDSYQANGFIALRRVAVLHNDKDCEWINDRNHIVSVAAGIACRLLNSPACRCVESVDGGNDGDINAPSSSVDIGIAVALQDDTSNEEGVQARLAQFSLSVGDAIAINHDGSMVLEGQHDHGAIEWFSFVPHDAKDDEGNPTFINPLYGMKGETPTTVVQWSKGTIF